MSNIDCYGGINNFNTTFTLLPNPANESITITSTSIFNTVEIVSFLGQTILSQPANGNRLTLDVSNLTNGVYFVRIITENGASVQKFVKQ
jgi:hypothetical protein